MIEKVIDDQCDDVNLTHVARHAVIDANSDSVIRWSQEHNKENISISKFTYTCHQLTIETLASVNCSPLRPSAACAVGELRAQATSPPPSLYLVLACSRPAG